MAVVNGCALGGVSFGAFGGRAVSRRSHKRLESPAAACWCCECWTGLAAWWLGGPPCCPPGWPWPVGVAEG